MSEQVSIEKLVSAPYNPRRMSTEKFEQLKASIKRFNVYEPLMVNRKNMHIIGGNQRYRALLELGFKTVDVVWASLPLAEEMALNAALNKITGEFVDASLAVIFQELQKTPHLLEMTGFELPEIFRILDKQAHYIGEDYSTEDVPTQNIIVKLGDLVELGPNKLFCGDCTIAENLEKLLGQERIALRHDDLPYCIKYDPRKHAKDQRKKKARRTFKMIENDDLTTKEHIEWMRKLLQASKPFMNPGAVLYLWDGFRNFGGLTQLLEEEGFCVSNVITWTKNSPCPGYSDYKFSSEFLLYSWLKNGKHRWFGPPNETNVWSADRLIEDTRLHPTAKPISLARRVLRNSSQRGDVVFDGCMGAGFNLIACQEMGRVFRGMDIEPAYIQASIFRYLRAFGVNSVSKQVRDRYFGRGKR